MTPEQAENSKEWVSIWHVPEHELFQMSQLERDRILNERTNRLYDALTTLTITRLKATHQQVDRILNREQYTSTESSSNSQA